MVSQILWGIVCLASFVIGAFGLYRLFTDKLPDDRSIGLLIALVGSLIFCVWLTKSLRGKKIGLMGMWVLFQLIAPLLPIGFLAARNHMNGTAVQWYALTGGEEFYFYALFVGMAAIGTFAEMLIELLHKANPTNETPLSYPVYSFVLTILIVIAVTGITIITMIEEKDLTSEALTNRAFLIGFSLVFLIPLNIRARVRSL